MVRTLGLFDILAGLLFLAVFFKFNAPTGMVIFFTFYLLLKGVIFLFGSFNFFSLVDITAGILLILTVFFALPQLVFLIVAPFLILKGAVSVFS